MLSLQRSSPLLPGTYTNQGLVLTWCDAISVLSFSPITMHLSSFIPAGDMAGGTVEVLLLDLFDGTDHERDLGSPAKIHIRYYPEGESLTDVHSRTENRDWYQLCNHWWYVASQDMSIDDYDYMSMAYCKTAVTQLRWNYCSLVPSHRCEDTNLPLTKTRTGPRRNIKTVSPGMGDFHYKDKTVVTMSCLYNGDSSTGKTISIYWDNTRHMTADNLIDIGSGNGLPPARCQPRLPEPKADLIVSWVPRDNSVKSNYCWVSWKCIPLQNGDQFGQTWKC